MNSKFFSFMFATLRVICIVIAGYFVAVVMTKSISYIILKLSVILNMWSFSQIVKTNLTILFLKSLIWFSLTIIMILVIVAIGYYLLLNLLTFLYKDLNNPNIRKAIPIFLKIVFLLLLFVFSFAFLIVQAEMQAYLELSNIDDLKNSGNFSMEETLNVYRYINYLESFIGYLSNFMFFLATYILTALIFNDISKFYKFVCKKLKLKIKK